MYKIAICDDANYISELKEMLQWPDDYWNDLEAPIEWIFVYDLDF